MSDDVLDRAKTQQRSTACSTLVSIRLSLLEDLIAEIERLRARLGIGNQPAPQGLREVKNAAEK